MILEFPPYYSKFQCVAGNCPDTCCRDWELDLDDETYYRYQVVPGPLGEKIRGLIREEDGYRFFPLTKEGFCPFYDGSDGLCGLIKKLGPDILCQACDEYPRYFGCCGNYEQRDLSLSCPEAGRLFFETPGIPRLLRVKLPDSEEQDPLTKEETDRLQAVLAERNRVLESLRGAAGEDLESDLKAAGIFFPAAPQEVADLCSKQEEMNTRWKAQKAGILAAAVHYADWNEAFVRAVPGEQDWFFKLAAYFVFRYWIDAYFAENEELDFAPQIRLTCRCLVQLRLMCLAAFHEKGHFTVEDMVWTCHLFSRQVEHSDENLDLFRN